MNKYKIGKTMTNTQVYIMQEEPIENGQQSAKTIIAYRKRPKRLLVRDQSISPMLLHMKNGIDVQDG